MLGENSVFDLVRCPDDESWLAERRKGVGGSDAAAVMGLSPWRSPYEVWLEKTGRADAPDLSGSQAVHWGQVLEPVVGGEYKRLHPERRVRRVNALLRSVARPWAQASLDYEVEDPELGWGVLEIKTAGLRSARDWEEGVPVHYQVQAAHYLSVTGRGFCDVAVLIGGQDYREHRIVRDADDVSVVETAVDRFWRFVEDGVEPPFLGTDGESAALLGQHPAPSGDIVLASGDVERDVMSYLELKRVADDYAKRARAAAARLKDEIGDDHGLSCPGGILTWSRYEKQDVDLKRLREDHPGLVAEYTRARRADGGLRWKAAR